MAPKNNAKGGDKKAAAKGKGKDAGEDAGKGKGKGGLKAASSINVRHILVCSLLFVVYWIPVYGLVGEPSCYGTESDRSAVRKTLQEGRGT